MTLNLDTCTDPQLGEQVMWVTPDAEPFKALNILINQRKVKFIKLTLLFYNNTVTFN